MAVEDDCALSGQGNGVFVPIASTVVVVPVSIGLLLVERWMEGSRRLVMKKQLQAFWLRQGNRPESPKVFASKYESCLCKAWLAVIN